MEHQSHVDTVVIDGDILEAARELRVISAQKKALADREETLKAFIAAHLGAGERGVSPDGEAMVTIRNGAARFDASLAEKHLPKDILAQIMTVQPDPKRAKEILAPALYDLCCRFNKPSVVAL